MTDFVSLFPSYYLDFKCIASKCRHTCCAGWEIDIDEATLSLYQSNPKLMAKIKGNSFIMGEDLRCPFLNKDNLCEIILDKGEDYLCDICTEHPRFYNYRGRIEEVGIGLCCEEAARLILSSTDNSLLSDSDEVLTDEELEFIKRREDKVVYLQNKLRGLEVSDKIFEVYKKCERLEDKTFTNLLDRAVERKTYKLPSGEEYDRASGNLINYLVYRHGDSLDESFFTDFTLLCGVFYTLLTNKADFDINIYAEAARIISSEIEYSDFNPTLWLKN